MDKSFIASLEFDNKKLLESLKETKESIVSTKEEMIKIKYGSGETSKAYIEQQIKLKTLNTELNEGLKILGKLDAASKIDIYNYSQQGKSISALRKETDDLLKVRNRMVLDSQQNTEAFKKINEIIDKNTETIKNNVSEMEKQKMNIGNYTDSIVSAWNKIKSGDIKGFSQQISEISMKWKEMTKAAGENTNALSFGFSKMFTTIKAGIVSVPVVGWIAGIVAAVGYGIKQMFDYNKSIAANIKLLDNMHFDKKLQPQINAVAKYFKLSFEQVAEAADKMLDLGIVKDEAQAIEQIKIGLVKAPDKNNFITTIEQTAQTAQRLGLSLSNVVNIKEDIEEKGLNSDKVFGGLEMSINKISGNAEKLRPALEKSFGTEFTNKLFKDLNNHTITYGEALAKIYDQGEQQKISDVERAEIAKGLFGKMSANAFAYNENLQLINSSYRDMTANLTQSQKNTLEQINLTIKLEEAKDKALKSDSILAFNRDLKNLKLQAQTFWYNILNWLNKADRAVGISGAYVRGVFIGIGEVARKSFNGILDALKILLDGFGSAGKTIGYFFTGQFEKASQEKDKFINSFSDFGEKLKKSVDFGTIGERAMKEADAFRKKYDAEIKAKAEAEKLDEKKGNENSSLPSNGEIKGNDKKDKLIEEAAKKAKDIAERNAKASAEIMKQELDAYIAANKTKIEAETFLTQAILEEEEKRNKLILDKKLLIMDKERQTELSNKELTELEKQAIIAKYQNQEKTLLNEFLEAKKQDELRYNKQLVESKKLQILIQQKERLQELEAGNASEAEIKREQNQQAFENDTERLTLEKEMKQLQQQQQDDETIAKEFEIRERLGQIRADYVQKDVEIISEGENAKLDVIAGAAGAIAGIMGQETILGKAAALTQATINTYLGATKAIAQGGVWGIVQAVAVIAAGMANVSKIAGVNVGNAASGFNSFVGVSQKAGKAFGGGNKKAKGGIIDGASHAQGGVGIFDDKGNYLAEVEEGELLAVVSKSATKELQFLSDMNIAHGGVSLTENKYVKRASNGGMIDVAISATQNDMVKAIRDAVYAATAKGTFDGSQQGIEKMYNNRNILENAKF